MSDSILFVDDEPSVLRALNRLFRRESLDVSTAGSGEAALELLGKQDFKVIVSDQRMPEMSGTEFLRRAGQIRPYSIRCILSGYAEMHAIVDAINEGQVYRFLTKPWNDAELTTEIRACISHYDAAEHERAGSRQLQEESQELAEMLEVRESLLKLSRDVLDGLPVAVAAVDSDLRVVFTNRAFGEIVPATAGALPGQRLQSRWSSLAGQFQAHSGNAKPVKLDIEGIPGQVHVSLESIGDQRFALLAIHYDLPSH